MYKDADKQKEANKERQRRYRQKALLNQGDRIVTPKSNALHPDIIASIDAIASGPEDRARRIKGAEDYAQLFTNRPAYSEFAKRMAQAGPGHVRVSKPGDDDYVCSDATPSPVPGTSIYFQRRTMASEPHTAPVVDEQQDKA